MELARDSDIQLRIQLNAPFDSNQSIPCTARPGSRRSWTRKNGAASDPAAASSPRRISSSMHPVTGSSEIRDFRWGLVRLDHQAPPAKTIKKIPRTAIQSLLLVSFIRLSQGSRHSGSLTRLRFETHAELLVGICTQSSWTENRDTHPKVGALRVGACLGGASG